MTHSSQSARNNNSIFTDIDEARLVAYGRHLRSVAIRQFVVRLGHWFTSLVRSGSTGPQECTNCP